MNSERIPLSAVIRQLHEKIQKELDMYKYAGKESSIVHQVAENEDAIEKVLSKPKKKKKQIDEMLLKDRSKNPNTINLKDDGASQNDIMDSTQFIDEIINLVKNGSISFPDMKKPNLVRSDLENQLANLESKSEYQPFRISRSKITKNVDEILIASNGVIGLNPKIFTPDGVLIGDEETKPEAQSKPKPPPSLFNVRHGEASATAPVQSTLTPKGNK